MKDSIIVHDYLDAIEKLELLFIKDKIKDAIYDESTQQLQLPELKSSNLFEQNLRQASAQNDQKHFLSVQERHVSPELDKKKLQSQCIIGESQMENSQGD